MPFKCELNLDCSDSIHIKYNFDLFAAEVRQHHQITFVPYLCNLSFSKQNV